MKSVNRKRKIIIAVILILTLFLTWIIWTNLAILLSKTTRSLRNLIILKLHRYQIYITVNWETDL